MTVKNTTDVLSPEIINDDLSNSLVPTTPQTPDIDPDKLAQLKAKLEEQNGNKKMNIEVKKERSINFGVVGSGQAGGRLAETFYKLGYDSIAINTASQDLKFLNLPESNKLLIQNGLLGGAAKELELGKSAAEAYSVPIAELVNKQLSDAQMLVLCLSLGGGSGAGSVEPMVDILSATGKPVVVITVLPMDSEDSQTKSNSIITLSKLSKFAQTKKIANLIVVDNTKIEAIYSQVSQVDFYNVANQAIVEPLDAFNKFSVLPSSVKPLDPTEFAKILIDGEGLSTYGQMIVENYQSETAIAETVVSSLGDNLLASGFDLKQSKYVGVIIAANKEVWNKIPSVSVNYAMAMIGDICGTPKGTFKGIYVVDDPRDCVMIYSFFSGLGLPTTKIEQLKKDAETLSKNVQHKEEQRNLTLNLDTGKEENVNKVQEIKNKIAAKSSTFGKFTGGGTIDKRNK